MPTAADALLGPRPTAWPLQRPPDLSDAAFELAQASEIADLHLDSFISARLLGYDLRRRHGLGLSGGRFFGQLDWPRALAGGLTLGMWSLTTNPFRTAAGRWRTFKRNLEAFQSKIASFGPDLRIVRDSGELDEARAAGSHAVLLAVQGGNALEAAPGGVADLPRGLIWRVTLVHLTNSAYGPTSSPLGLWRRGDPLSAAGRALVEGLDEARILVDVAHLGHRAVRDVAACHDPSLPLCATHTGVAGVTPHWRNLDDEELRLIAASDGVVGVIYQAAFLRRPGGPAGIGMVVEHLDHIRRTLGVRHCAIGTDYDGAIVPPTDVRDGAVGYLRLIDALLRAGWRDDEVQAVLAGNTLRVLRALRPAGWAKGGAPATSPH